MARPLPDVDPLTRHRYDAERYELDWRAWNALALENDPSPTIRIYTVIDRADLAQRRAVGR